MRASDSRRTRRHTSAIKRGWCADVDLSENELALVRQLLFRELYDIAGALAEQAAAAAYGGNADRDTVAGDDAHSTWRHRVQVTAGVLDRVGWSVRTDTAVLVESERSRRVS